MSDGHLSDDATIDEDEHVGLVEMPPNFLTSARDILGRAVGRQELLAAWDACSNEHQVDARMAAVLDFLMGQAGNPQVDDASENNNDDARPPTSNDPQGKPEKRKRRTAQEPQSYIDISDDSDDPTDALTTRRAARQARETARRSSASIISIEDDDNDEAIQRSVENSFTSAKGDQNTGVRFELPAASTAPNSASSASSASTSTSAQSGGSDTTPGSSVLDAGPSTWLVQVLAMVPDVDTEHAKALIDTHSNQVNCVEHVIDALFGDSNYPKAKMATASSSKGKQKLSPAEQQKMDAEKWTDIAKRGASSMAYCMEAFDVLVAEFPMIPKPYIRAVHISNKHYYAPTLFQLQADTDKTPRPFTILSTGRRDKGKGKAAEVTDPELLEERLWVRAARAAQLAETQAKLAEQQRDAEEEAAGLTIECGCCFTESVFSKMIQCPDAHLFCMDCGRRNAENVLGLRQIEICCMDQDGCTAQFTASELARCLTQGQLDMLERFRSEKAIDLAELEGLSKCPHCPWACVIEDPNEKLLRCKNDECMRVTCRKCQKADHLPKSCEEYADDLKKNNIHKVEEAMTAAFIKKCPKCAQAFVKEEGCNKMICTNCRTMSCFVCGKQINGYDHFHGQPPMPGGVVNASAQKCPLWDDTAKRQYDAVEEARKAAAAEVKAVAEEGHIDDAEIEKLKAAAPPPRAANDPYGRMAGMARPPPPYFPHAPAYQPGPAGAADRQRYLLEREAQHARFQAEMQAMHAQRAAQLAQIQADPRYVPRQANHAAYQPNQAPPAPAAPAPVANPPAAYAQPIPAYARRKRKR